MKTRRARTRHCASFNTRLRPLAAAALIGFAAPSQAGQVASSTTGAVLSDDSSYVVPPGTTITTQSENAIDVTAIAPVTFNNAGVIVSAVDNQAAAIKFYVPATLTNNAGGALLGNTFGVLFDGGGNSNDLINRGDISARTSHGVAYIDASGGTFDNFGTINGAVAGPIKQTPNGVYIGSTGTVIINNHAKASIASGVGDATYGDGIFVETGSVVINNDGSITGYQAGVVNTGTLPMSVVNSSTGSIQSTVGAGVQLQQDSTLVNNGKIASAGSAAILLVGSNNRVTLGTGSSLQGANDNILDIEGLGNTLALTGSAVQSGNIATGRGPGLSQLTSGVKSVWTLTGNIAIGGTTPDALNVIGDLTLGGTLTQHGGASTVQNSGSLTIGTGSAGGSLDGDVVNNGMLRFNRNTVATFAGQIVGNGTLIQAGSGATHLTKAGSSQGTVVVEAGTLGFDHPGAFNAGVYTTRVGGTTSISDKSSLQIATNFTQEVGSALNVGIGKVQPIITASTATLRGALTVSGFGADAPNTASALTSTQFNIIRTTGGISGDFASVGFSGTQGPADYLTLTGAKSPDGLNYNVGFGLTWRAPAAIANGTFTLADAASTFNLDVPLADRVGVFASGWDGRTLTKTGPGLLIVSAPLIHTGGTLIDGGTLRTDVTDSLATSSNVNIASGATLDMNGFAQQINQLSGAGAVALGGAALTAVNLADTAFSGTIGGSGSVVKTGPATLSLSGASTYSGGTTIATGKLIAATGTALGAGAVTNNAILQLDFANDALMLNTLSGSGALLKTGVGAANLAASGSTQGAVSVEAGTLRLLQTGAFTTAADWTTASGATTALSSRSQLEVGRAFTMTGTLSSIAGVAEPVISASTASIGPGAIFNLAGYTAAPATSAAQLAAGAFTEIHATTPGGLSGTFASTRIGGTASSVDFLTLSSAYTAQNYNVGVGLTWYAAHGTTPATANGVFTLVQPGDSFDMDVVLANETANQTTGWDGKTLTKAGAGTLQLSKANTYTGATLIEGGTLQAGAENVIAPSSRVMLSPGTTFDLNGFNQQVTSLAGAGNVSLGTATLTANYSTNTVFDGVISGSGGFTKTGAGRLILSADHTYTAPTTIDAGVLQLGTGGASGSVAGDIVNNGALVFNRSDRYVYGHSISGTGALTQQGSGALLLPGSQTYSGTTQVNSGALILTDNAQLPNTPQVSVAQGATFGGYGGVGGAVVNNGLLAVADAAPGFANAAAGAFSIGGTLTNNGEIRMSSPTPTSTLTVAGNYIGNNGLLTLSTALGSDGSATDRLIVHGDSAGQTAVKVRNAGGAGAITSNGIRIVQVDGQSNGQFTLDGRVVAGPYEYNLYKGGASTPADGNWYLRTLTDGPSPTPTPAPRPEPGGYLGNQAAARDMFVMTLHDRAGFPDPFAVDGMSGNESTAWVRTRAAHTDGNAAGGRLAESTDTALFQAGIDLLHRMSNAQHWQAGIMAGYGSSTTDATARNNPATARGNVNGASAGVYATWRANALSPVGPYVDTWLQYAHFDNTVKGAQLNGESYASHTWGGSVEGGWAFAVGQTSSGPVLIEPQAQVIYSNYAADDHVESGGTIVHGGNINALTTRVGMRVFHAPGSAAAPGWLPYLEVNWWHDTSGNSIAFNQIVVSQDGPRNRLEVKVGAQAQLARNWRLWGNLGYQQGDGGYRSYQGLLGARYIW